MKRIGEILLISMLGGALTLGAYVTFFTENAATPSSGIHTTEKNAMVQANYNTTRTASFENTDFTHAASETLNAVVHVKNTAITTSVDPFRAYFYGQSQGLQKRAQVGMGSGVIISSDGYIITNNHVIDNATEIEITMDNKKTYIATLIGTDVKNDIALVKIEGHDFPYITFGNSDNVKVGEWVLAVGNPYNLTSTVTAGIISAKGRDLAGSSSIDSFLQTDAAVNPGNSGGALVNIRGELIGINTAISSQTGSFIGYSFAVPSNIAKKVIEDIMEYGTVQRAMIGISYSIKGAHDFEGVKIGEITPDGGADMAGLHKGDVITKINEVKISEFSDLSGQLSAKRPGDNLEVTFSRNGKEMTRTVTLTKNNFKELKVLGLILKDLEPQEASKYQLNGGAKIASVSNRDLLNLGVEKGFIIVKINKKEVRNADDAIQLISSKYGKEVMYIEMMNNRGQIERYVFR
ncbi:MAG: trypsin-like peptidase domain-containing protein [Flavobacteriaceae bacterium]|nr:trypsin-like peptidase domain-containing protein [Flavobacteriaceae bacterium]